MGHLDAERARPHEAPASPDIGEPAKTNALFWSFPRLSLSCRRTLPVVSHLSPLISRPPLAPPRNCAAISTYLLRVPTSPQHPIVIWHKSHAWLSYLSLCSAPSPALHARIPQSAAAAPVYRRLHVCTSAPTLSPCLFACTSPPRRHHGRVLNLISAPLQRLSRAPPSPCHIDP
jgi:hypothetical protein